MHYASLNSYFQSEDAPKSTNNGNGVESEWVGAERLKKAFDDRLTEVYLKFFSGVLPISKQTNILLQREVPRIHLVHSQLNRFLMQLAGMFMPVAEIRNPSQVSDINTNNQKP